MPPRKGFGLSLQLPPDSAAAPGQGDAGGAPPRVGAGGELLHQSLRDSWEVGSNGAVTLLSKSITPYQFSAEGLVKAVGGRHPHQQHQHQHPQQQHSQQQHPHHHQQQQQQQHYRVSDRDIFLIKPLGRGASSVVFKGFLAREGCFVAVKRINILQKETRQQMMNDVKALCDAPGAPGLIRFHGAFHVPGSGAISLVLEHMDGGSLADVLAKAGRVPEPVLASIAARVLQGLAFLHRRRLVHRDIKPANILVSTRGEAKISDFGISAFVTNTVANCQTFTGTVTYMSPERIEGRPYSFPADVWSLGLVVAEAATGRYPYDATGGPVALMVQVLQDEPPLPPQGEGFSEELRDFVRRCLSVDPSRRPTAEQLLGHPWLSRACGSGGGSGGHQQQQQQQQQPRLPVPLPADFPQPSAPLDGPGTEAKAFMARFMLDPLEKMDEIAFQFAWMFYGALSSSSSASSSASSHGGSSGSGSGGGGGGPGAGAGAGAGAGGAYGDAGLRRLAGLYAPTSRLAFDGHLAEGREAILARLAAATGEARARLCGGRREGGAGATWGGAAWRLRHVDSQPLGTADGAMLVHATGEIVAAGAVQAGGGVGGGGGGAAAAGMAVDSGSGSDGVGGAARWLFADAFVLKRSPTGEYFIPSQTARTMQQAV